MAKNYEWFLLGFACGIIFLFLLAIGFLAITPALQSNMTSYSVTV